MVLRTISHAYLELGIFDKAYEFLQKAHSVYPENSRLKIDFGNYYYKINDYKTAQRYYLEADSKDLTNNAQLYSNIASTYFVTENYDQSIEYLNKAINLYTSDPFFYFHLGLCYLLKGAFPQAQRNFLEAIELYPPLLLDVINPIFGSKPRLKAIKQKSVQEEISVPEKTSKQEETPVTEQTSIQAEAKQDTVQDELSIEEEWQKEIEKECQEIISRAKELTATKKLQFKIYHANDAVPTIKDLPMNSQMGWGAKYPKPTDEGVHKLTWKGLPAEKSRIYGFIDEEAPDIKKLDKETLNKFKATLAKGRIVNRAKNQDGVKLATPEENPDFPSKLKILGTNGQKKRRIWADKVTNKAGEELHIYKHDISH